jgi:hypothetical protein
MKYQTKQTIAQYLRDRGADDLIELSDEFLIEEAISQGELEVSLLVDGEIEFDRIDYVDDQSIEGIKYDLTHVPFKII